MSNAATIKHALVDLIGSKQVTDDALEKEFYSHDVYSRLGEVGLIVSPTTTEQLASVVQLANEHGVPMVARGGGMSYSGGYTPEQDGSLMIDMSQMSEVLEINKEDMYVTVQAGISWKALHETLEPLGLRTPYWGTLSGIKATVGGSVSQNSIFWGSGEYGSAADSVLSLGMVLADGRVINTGSAAKPSSKPFFRHFGPDMTGIFTADCGALGFKATVTLRLMPVFEERGFCSYAFETHADMLSAMSAIARDNLAMEVFGFDPYLQAQRMKRESLSRDVSQLVGVLKSAGGIGKAVKDGVGIAMSGRRYMKDVSWSFNAIIEDTTQAGIKRRLEKINEIAVQFNGNALADSIPKLVRSNPFGPVNNMVGPEGERWVPVHGLVPHSQVNAAMTGLEALFARHQAVLDKYEIGIGYLVATVSTTCTVLEPVFFWPDQLQEVHKRSLEPAHLKNLKGFPTNLEARESVATIRKEVAQTLQACGAINLQIGKSYPYRESIDPNVYAILESLKNTLDPKRLINPGVLGL